MSDQPLTLEECSELLQRIKDRYQAVMWEAMSK